MTLQDTEKLINLLSALYRSNPPGRDKVTRNVWHLVLEPWDYSVVREAVVKRSRTNVHCPNPSEIAVMLPPLPEPKTEEDDEDARRARADIELALQLLEQFGEDVNELQQ